MTSSTAELTVKPCLWFDADGLEAAEFYTSLVPNSQITDVQRQPDGSALMVEFTLGGRPFQALNGGPKFTFSEAISFSIACPTQDEADRLWAALTADGEESMCGWLKDRYGLSWQIIPPGVGELLSDPDPQRAQAAMSAMLSMHKLDVPAMRAAADAAAG